MTSKRCQCVWMRTTGDPPGQYELHACAACLLGGLITRTELPLPDQSITDDVSTDDEILK